MQTRRNMHSFTWRRFLSRVRREELGQAAMVVVAGLLLIMTAVPAIVMSRELRQAPIIDNSVLATAAMAAAKAGISDYIDHLYANPGTNDPTPQYSNYTDYCSSNVFVSKSDVGGCTNDTNDSGNPAFWNPTGLTSSPSSCSSSWCSGLVGERFSTRNGVEAQYGYLVNTTTLQSPSSGGYVYVYSYGMARWSSSSPWVYSPVVEAQIKIPQLVSPTVTYTSPPQSFSCGQQGSIPNVQPGPLTITVAGGGGGPGDGGSGSNGNGGNGALEIATYQVSSPTTISYIVGCAGQYDSSPSVFGYGQGAGGISGNAGSGGGSSAVCVGTSCNGSNVLVAAGGGGGGSAYAICWWFGCDTWTESGGNAGYGSSPGYFAGSNGSGGSGGIGGYNCGASGNQDGGGAGSGGGGGGGPGNQCAGGGGSGGNGGDGGGGGGSYVSSGVGSVQLKSVSGQQGPGQETAGYVTITYQEQQTLSPGQSVPINETFGCGTNQSVTAPSTTGSVQMSMVATVIGGGGGGSQDNNGIPVPGGSGAEEIAGYLSIQSSQPLSIVVGCGGGYGGPGGNDGDNTYNIFGYGQGGAGTSNGGSGGGSSALCVGTSCSESSVLIAAGGGGGGDHYTAFCWNWWFSSGCYTYYEPGGSAGYGSSPGYFAGNNGSGGSGGIGGYNCGASGSQDGTNGDSGGGGGGPGSQCAGGGGSAGQSGDGAGGGGSYVSSGAGGLSPAWVYGILASNGGSGSNGGNGSVKLSFTITAPTQPSALPGPVTTTILS